MDKVRSDSSTRPVDIVRLAPKDRQQATDLAVVEEPLQIVINGAAFAVIMRTPGTDRDLAAGFLLGERIVISWNCSTESARTVAYAMPLLLKAREVAVLTVEGAVSPGPSGKELADCLAVHGIEARELTVLAGGRKPGAAILEEAERLGADLLVKGAYTQSRLRQMIFGGATSHILANTELPVFMAH